MNPKMWANAATKRNVERLQGDGILFVGPEMGEMAEPNEAGFGRMAEPAAILAAIEEHFSASAGPLAGRRAIVTSGPTHEPIDPVRYLANRSSGRQGHAIAAALAKAGADVTLVSGPVAITAPSGMKVVAVETAREMQQAVEAALPADIAVMAAAVADWRAADARDEKIKKDGKTPAQLSLVENPDILAGLAQAPRPAETSDRLRGRNGRPDGQRPGEAEAQRLRLDRCERCVAGNRHHGRCTEPRAPCHGSGRRGLARNVEGSGG